MKELPMLFSAPMVRAILAGTKTQTRRIFSARNGGVWPNPNDRPGMQQVLRACPYGQPGERLWVRETFQQFTDDGEIMYAADPRHFDSMNELKKDEYHEARWRPSIHMPRWASRITLEVTSVRIERLQDISEADAIAEGCRPDAGFHGEDDLMVGTVMMRLGVPAPVARFVLLWDSINGSCPGNWNSNPWVWVVEFKRVEGGAA